MARPSSHHSNSHQTASARRRARGVAEVTAVAVEPVGPDLARLTVTARHGGERSARTVCDAEATIRHAARALVHHYGLRSEGDDRWSAADAHHEVDARRPA